MFRSGRIAAGALLLFASCCVAGGKTPHPDVPRSDQHVIVDIAATLLSADEPLITKTTEDVLAGRRMMSKAALTDDRPISPNVVLRARHGNRDYQLGVNTVDEYALCVLQLRDETSSSAILRSVDPDLERRCSLLSPCEICNAQAFPVSAIVKKRLAEYWTSRLE
jgi:hypothetical protein